MLGKASAGRFARGDALLEEASLHRAASERQRGLEVGARRPLLSPAELEITERCEVERIGAQAIAPGNRPNLFEPALGTRELPDGDRSVERDNGRWPDRHQRIVEAHD